MERTKKAVIAKIKNSVENNCIQLYNHDCINWKGVTNDENKEKYSEIIAEELLNLEIVKKLKGISPIKRNKSYKIESHDAETKQDTYRKEEIFAKKLVRDSKIGKKFGEVGKFIDYQVPLKSSRSDKGIGKIDLFSYIEKDKIVYLHELKFGNNSETLLKCILEIATYYQILDKQKFLADYKKELNNLKPENIKKAVLICEYSKQHQEITNFKNNSKLKELIKKLEVNIFLIPFSIRKVDL